LLKRGVWNPSLCDLGRVPRLYCPPLLRAVTKTGVGQAHVAFSVLRFDVAQAAKRRGGGGGAAAAAGEDAPAPTFYAALLTYLRAWWTR
jgi:hypothetical protein